MELEDAQIFCERKSRKNMALWKLPEFIIFKWIMTWAIQNIHFIGQDIHNKFYEFIYVIFKGFLKMIKVS